MDVETLRDLIRINNDRIAGYRKSMEELGSGDADLKALFSDMIQESEQHVVELSREAGDNPVQDTTSGGKLYRAWMDLKKLFTGKDRKTILENCESVEDAALKAYREALESEGELSNRCKNLIMVHQIALQGAHDKIKTLRDKESDVS
jgi:uncharacterized protein (TIGR02284 family)